MTSAVERALALPELLSLIFQHLEDDLPSLHSAILVDRSWYDQAHPVIWQKPDLDAFRFLSAERRQQHANEVRVLDFDCRDPTVHDEHGGLQWPRLRSLTFRSPTPRSSGRRLRGPGSDIAMRYFQPSLRHIELYYRQFSHDLVRMLHSQCPRLRRLEVETVGKYVDGLPSLLEPLRELDDITFRIAGSHKQAPRELFRYFAGRHPLKALNFRHRLSLEDVESLRDAVQLPFSQLPFLRLIVRYDALQSLVPMIKHITQLDLIVPFCSDGNVQIISRLQPMQSLEVLKIGYPDTGEGSTFNSYTMITVDEVVALKAFPKLRELSIGGGDGFAGFQNLTPNVLSDVLSSLPQLRSICLAVNANAQTPEDDLDLLATLGKGNRQLEECELRGVFKLQDLDRYETPLFPVLKKLTLAVITPDPISRYDPTLEAAWDQIIRHGPALKSIFVDYNGDFWMEKGVNDERPWRGRSRNRQYDNLSSGEAD